MATTVTYKGEVLTTLTNQTKVLNTSGKYMEDDVTIEDVSSGGAAVVVSEETTPDGGIIKYITAIDLSNDTVSSATLLSGYTAHDFQGNAIVGTYSGGGITPTGTINITSNGTYDVTAYASASVSVAGQTVNNQNKTVSASTVQTTVTYDNGYTGLGTVTINAIPTGTAGTPTATKSAVSNNQITITPSVTNTTGYITGSTKTGTGVTVSANELVSGTKSITANGSNIDVTNYATVSVNVPTGTDACIVTITYNEQQDKWIPDLPFSDIQTARAAGKDIIVNCSDSDIEGRVASADGYVSPPEYSAELYYQVHWIYQEEYYATYIYNNLGLIEQDRYQLTSPSGTKTITSNGTSIDVYNYEYVDVNVPSSINNQNKSATPTESQQSITYDTGYTGLGTVTIAAISSNYVGSNIATRSSADLTVNGGTVTAPAGYYSASAAKAVSALTLPTSAAAQSTSGYTLKATINRSTSSQYINIGTGYNSQGGYYVIASTPNGTVTAPTTITSTGATLTTGTNTLTLSRSVSVTPNVTTAGYISQGTAGNATVTLTASVTTKGAATITPTTTNQTIASGTYLTGTQTISGDANLVGSNILSGKSIFGVAGTVTFQTYYTGSTAPAASLGSNGDIYLQS